MTGGMERMPDAALSRKLGHYQKMAAVWRLVGACRRCGRRHRVFRGAKAPRCGPF